VPFDFSIDNDREPENLVATLDSAASKGWKIKLKYQQVWGLLNIFQNRGETNHFVTSVEVLDKDPMGSVFGNNTDRIEGSTNVCGKVVDTIYVVIDKSR
jgi:hypothetical protein